MNIINTYGIAGSVAMLTKFCRKGTTVTFDYENVSKVRKTVTSKISRVTYQDDLNNYAGWHWTIKVRGSDNFEHSCILENIYNIKEEVS